MHTGSVQASPEAWAVGQWFGVQFGSWNDSVAILPHPTLPFVAIAVGIFATGVCEDTATTGDADDLGLPGAAHVVDKADEGMKGRRGQKSAV